MERVVTIKEPEIISTEPPREITKENVVHWSRHYKELIGFKEGNAIRTKAKRWLKEGLIRYDKEMGVWYCDPLKGYNKSIYTIKFEGKELTCSCQFYNKVCKREDSKIHVCSHTLAVWMWLRINNNKR